MSERDEEELAGMFLDEAVPFKELKVGMCCRDLRTRQIMIKIPQYDDGTEAALIYMWEEADGRIIGNFSKLVEVDKDELVKVMMASMIFVEANKKVEEEDEEERASRAGKNTDEPMRWDADTGRWECDFNELEELADIELPEDEELYKTDLPLGGFLGKDFYKNIDAIMGSMVENEDNLVLKIWYTIKKWYEERKRYTKGSFIARKGTTDKLALKEGYLFEVDGRMFGISRNQLKKGEWIVNDYITGLEQGRVKSRRRAYKLAKEYYVERLRCIADTLNYVIDDKEFNDLRAARFANEIME